MMRATVISTLAFYSQLGVGIAAADVDSFDWSTVEPSSSLNYTACYDGHDCAKLVVPLDWLNPETNAAQVTLAIISRPAAVSKDNASFGGTIIVNPGGPSGSGIGLVLGLGELIQRTADTENRKYEILSFDPRGVGFTEPHADCYHDEFARGSSVLEDRAMGAPDEGIDVVRRKMARAKAFGQLCESKAQGKDDIRLFMSTSSVARDMVAIVDQLDELHKEAQLVTEDGDQQERVELRSDTEKDDTPRIQYWGFSYGTVLGNYFASMFPGRVGRMILEGVEDVHDYYNATWALNLEDTQKVLDHFWETCYEGGSRCALFKSADTSPTDIRDRVREMLDGLDESPAPYLIGNSLVSITKQDVIDTIFHVLYNPMRDFPILATALNDALQGNFTFIYNGLGLPTHDNNCPLGDPLSYTWGRDAQTAIACGDSESQLGMTTNDFMAYVDHLKADSPDFGAQWSRIRLACKGWDFQPSYRFSGPWVTPEADPSLVKGKPAAPILFVTNLLDPVTPVANAREASKAHPGSTVIVQNSAGHGAALIPSKCREDIVKKYLETGELPAKEVWCEADCRPFQECGPVNHETAEVQLTAWNNRAPLDLV